MNLVKFAPAFLLGMFPAFAQIIDPVTGQTNQVNVDQAITLQANLSTLNITPIINTLTAPTTPGTTPSPGTDTTVNTVSTGTATLTIRFVGGNLSSSSPIPTPITGFTNNVQRAFIAISIQTGSTGTPTSQSFTSAQIYRNSAAPGSAGVLNLNPTSGGSTPGGPFGGNLNQQIEISTSAQLTLLREIVNNPSAFSIRLATTAFPNGFMSGTLFRAGDTANSFQTMRDDLILRLLVRMAYQQGVISAQERDAYLSWAPQPASSTPTNPNPVAP